MDPHASSVPSVTEYLATQGSSSFSNGHWPCMDTTRILLALKQGPRSLENYIRECLVIAHYSDLPDIILIEFFCDGINQPLQSKLRREGPRLSLSCFFGHCFVDCCSLFTVGFAEEERNITSGPVMAAVRFSQPQAQGHSSTGTSQKIRIW